MVLSTHHHFAKPSPSSSSSPSPATPTTARKTLSKQWQGKDKQNVWTGYDTNQVIERDDRDDGPSYSSQYSSYYGSSYVERSEPVYSYSTKATVTATGCNSSPRISPPSLVNVDTPSPIDSRRKRPPTLWPVDLSSHDQVIENDSIEDPSSTISVSVATADANDSNDMQASPKKEHHISFRQYRRSFSNTSMSPRSKTSIAAAYSFHTHWQPPKGVIGIVYSFVVVSWMYMARSLSLAKVEQTMLERKFDLSQRQLNRQDDSYQKVMNDINIVQQAITKLQKTHQALQHEKLVLAEMIENETNEMSSTTTKNDAPGAAQHALGRMSSIHPSSNTHVIEGWLMERRNDLQHRIISMQQYIQDTALRSAKAKYGLGPHKVKFVLEYKDPKLLKKALDSSTTSNAKDELDIPTVRGEFVVQLASLDQMPHSVSFFLDMVKSRLWDNTVFLHHENVEHVMAAAPVDFVTQTVKYHHLQYYGFEGLGFPEYSPQIPHTKYTLGFAGFGPTFYINTMDNSAHHGPGSLQGHFVLPTDADPCFGHVISGHNVIDSITVDNGTGQNPIEAHAQHPWANEQHTWTRIVEILVL
jgi:cyclophilin family peptidyl-prolyl cis-trans isomerase